MPPRYACFFWKTCITTCGWRPSSSSAARVWLKYASVYQPARIFSTGRSKTLGSRRVRVVITTRAPGTPATRPRRPRAVPQSARASRIGAAARGPASRAAARRDATGCASSSRTSPPMRRPHRGRAIARAGFRSRRGARSATMLPSAVVSEHRADEMRAAPLVLLRSRLTVLVRADRDVLRAVVPGELAAAERERRRCDRQDRRDELAGGRAQRAALDDVQDDGGARRATRARAGAASAAPPRAARASPAAGARTPPRAAPGRAAAGSRRWRRGTACGARRP